MSRPAEVSVALDQIGHRRSARATIAVVGNPNAGKSALFNRLTGMHQKTANYPGVTVERRTGRCRIGEDSIDLVDLPGTFSLTPNSADEAITVGVLFGRIEGTPRADGILAVIDSTRLYQGLYLLQQLVELGLPLVVALTMTDAAERASLRIDYGKLSALLGGVPVYPVVATTGRGFDAMLEGLAELPDTPPPSVPKIWPEVSRAVDSLQSALAAQGGWQRAEIERWLIEGDVVLEETGLERPSDDQVRLAGELRRELFGEDPPLAVEARTRYGWIRQVLPEVVTDGGTLRRTGAQLADWLNRPRISTLLFILTMGIVFQAVFAWATIFMDAIDAGVSAVGGLAAAWLPDGVISSFVVDGVIAGVGSVVIFLPQILILFLFIILMEDTGYLARAAFLVDRAMRSIGLSGQSVIPLLSSFACAVPSIMATRVIPNRRDRIATILAAPFMTCSARLPVYALMIAAFVPQRQFGPLNLQGLVLFGLYLTGIAGGVGTALLLKRSALRGQRPVFILALPEYRMPSLRSVLVKLMDRAKIFLRRAGTIIFTVAIVVWSLAYFPRAEDVAAQSAADIEFAENTLDGDVLAQRVLEIENAAAAAQLEQSWLGRAGRFVEPVFVPLGWDWRVSAAVIAGFPAREVVVAVLGTIYAVGGEADELTLAERLQSATWPDGRLVFTLPMVLGLLVFYAWCLQCAATLAVIRRETNSWRWAAFSWTYMTVLAYVAALVIFQVGTA
ncbi:MAG: ferrous iron transport protein B [Gammaproteobacteria bacterium]|jgi:ferrous iron transport protein B